MTGRREQNKARTRAAIVEAGIALMHEVGFEAASTTAIARAAGVAPATLFTYFPTKASIVFADDHLWSPPVLTPGPDPRATLRALVVGVLDRPEWTRGLDDPLTALRFDLVRREPALAAAQTARLMAAVPDLARALREAHPGLPEADAVALSGAVVGAVAATLPRTPGGRVRAAVLHAADVALGGAPGPNVHPRVGPAGPDHSRPRPRTGGPVGTSREREVARPPIPDAGE